MLKIKQQKMNFLPHIYKIIVWIFIIAVSASLSTFVNAKELADNKLYVFHPGINRINNTFLLSLVVALESQISSHKVEIVDTSKRTLAQLDSLTKQDHACAVTIGKSALQKVLTGRNSTPIFSTLVSKNELDRFIETYGRLGSKLTGIYQEQSFKRQLLLSTAIDYNAKEIAVILGINSRYSLKKYQTVSQSLGFDLFFNLLKHQSSPQRYFSKLAIKHGFLLILNDEEHYSIQDLQSLLVTSYKKQIPIIGAKQSDTSIAAIASIYTPYQSLVKETAKSIKSICKKSLQNTPQSMPLAKFNQNFAISINQEIAKSLGYPTLDNKSLANRVQQLESKPLEAKTR